MPRLPPDMMMVLPESVVMAASLVTDG
jgi:hypothetical protein